MDLDGTLVASDTLWESLCLLVRRHPATALRAPGWLREGKARFKGRVAERVLPDASLLPYRPEVLAHLRSERAAGRRIVLATAADHRVARAVAEQLALFDDVLASEGDRNLSGAAKREAIEKHSGGEPWAYLGSSAEDVEVWRGAAAAVLVAPDRRAREGVARLGIPSHEVPAPNRALAPVVRALRPHQWVKNGLLFVPIVLAQELSDLSRLAAVAVGFLAFCAVASTGYLANDLLDIEADRRHGGKQSRPFAAGKLSIPTGVATGAGLLLLGFGISLAALPWAFTGMLALYLTLTLSYSFAFKERLFVDVLLLAGLYTHRVLSGGVAAHVEVSTWLLAFSVFFFLSLALVKRYAELLATPVGGVEDEARTNAKLARRAYRPQDTGLVESMGVSSGYLSVLVLGLYVSREDVTRYYASPDLLWLISPLMLYWISRIWLLARRGEMSHDPVLFAATDGVSYLTGAGVVAIGLLAALLGR